MGFDVAGFLENLFSGTVAPVVAVPSGNVAGGPEPDLFAGWVQRADCHGRMGWEAPDVPEWQRWWAQGDFKDFPVVPEGFWCGQLAQPALQDCATSVSGGPVDVLDLQEDRPRQGLLRGFSGA